MGKRTGKNLFATEVTECTENNSDGNKGKRSEAAIGHRDGKKSRKNLSATEGTEGNNDGNKNKAIGHGKKNGRTFFPLCAL
jgi:hypothetical protein